MKKTKTLFGILTISLSLAVQVQAQSFLTNGLVAYYPFNGSANDASGNGHDATANGVYTYQTNANPFQHYIQTSGDHSPYYVNGGYVRLPDLTGIVTNNITVSLWVKLLDAMPDEYPVHFGMDNQFQQWMNIDCYQGFGIGDNTGIGGGTGVVRIPASFTNISGIWKHFVISYQPGIFAGYLDGSLVGQVAVTVSGLLLTPGSLGWHQWGFVGQPPVGTAARSSWQFTNVRIYNRALSDSEVQQLHVYESGPQLNLIKAVKPSFTNLTLTTNYQLQISGDLNTWTNEGSTFTATNTSMVYPQYWDVDNWGKLFFRLQLAP